MMPFPRCSLVRRRNRARRVFLFLGIDDDPFDDLEDWMIGAGETPTPAT
jgi:hypothetical protein